MRAVRVREERALQRSAHERQGGQPFESDVRTVPEQWLGQACPCAWPPDNRQAVRAPSPPRAGPGPWSLFAGGGGGQGRHAWAGSWVTWWVAFGFRGGLQSQVGFQVGLTRGWVPRWVTCAWWVAGTRKQATRESSSARLLTMAQGRRRNPSLRTRRMSRRRRRPCFGPGASSSLLST